MQTSFDRGLMWFRRDLRSKDNAALAHALRCCRELHCAFVFDGDILQSLPRQDRRVQFIHESLQVLDAALRRMAGSERAGLIAVHARASTEIPALAKRLGVQAVFANHDYEPQALARDAAVRGALAQDGILLLTFKDQVIFEKTELLTQSGLAYSVFTPYKNAWLRKLHTQPVQPWTVPAHTSTLAPRPDGVPHALPTLNDLGFAPSQTKGMPLQGGQDSAQALLAGFAHRIDRYHETRDYPAIRGPSYLSVHLRFGTLSVRAAVGLAHALAATGNQGAQTWLSELIWRDFYFQILANFPHVVDAHGSSHSFRREYDAIRWESGKTAYALFDAWCQGLTGYPLVDAAMAQINQTGYMHNRLRMVVASFLCKTLGLDWRWGERYFALQLNDFDLAANNGGWQWASSSGCDAQPYFRIFNPVSQSQRFDPEGKFIRKYLPQLSKLSLTAIHEPWSASLADLAAAGVVLGQNYPHRVVIHEEQRQRTLERYAAAKQASTSARIGLKKR